MVECYQVGFERDVFYMVQNNAIFYLTMLCKQLMTDREAFLGHLPLVEKVAGLLRRMTHD